MLIREDFRRRHECDLQPVLHRDQSGGERDDRLAGAHVSLEQPVHRLRPLHVLDDFLDRLFLSGREPERQQRTRRVADASVIITAFGLRSSSARRLRSSRPIWKRKNSSKISLTCAGVLNRLRSSTDVPGGWKVHRADRFGRRREVPATTDLVWQRIRSSRRQPLERVMNDSSLHLRRQRPGLLVDGDDPARVDRFLFRRRVLAFLLPHDLVLGIRQVISTAARQLQRAEQDDLLMRLEDVAQKWLVEIRDSKRAALIADDHVEDLESRPAGGPNARADDLDEDRGGFARLERRDLPELSAVLVTDREPVQQVFDGREANTLEVRRAARPDALQVPERSLQKLCRRRHHRVSLQCACTLPNAELRFRGVSCEKSSASGWQLLA